MRRLLANVLTFTILVQSASLTPSTLFGATTTYANFTTHTAPAWTSTCNTGGTWDGAFHLNQWPLCPPYNNQVCSGGTVWGTVNPTDQIETTEGLVMNDPNSGAQETAWIYYQWSTTWAPAFPISCQGAGCTSSNNEHCNQQMTNASLIGYGPGQWQPAGFSSGGFNFSTNSPPGPYCAFDVTPFFTTTVSEAQTTWNVTPVASSGYFNYYLNMFICFDEQCGGPIRDCGTAGFAMNSLDFQMPAASTTTTTTTTTTTIFGATTTTSTTSSTTTTTDPAGCQSYCDSNYPGSVGWCTAVAFCPIPPNLGFSFAVGMTGCNAGNGGPECCCSPTTTTTTTTSSSTTTSTSSTTTTTSPSCGGGQFLCGGINCCSSLTQICQAGACVSCTGCAAPDGTNSNCVANNAACNASACQACSVAGNNGTCNATCTGGQFCCNGGCIPLTIKCCTNGACASASWSCCGTNPASSDTCPGGSGNCCLENGTGGCTGTGPPGNSGPDNNCCNGCCGAGTCQASGAADNSACFVDCQCISGHHCVNAPAGLCCPAIDTQLCGGSTCCPGSGTCCGTSCCGQCDSCQGTTCVPGCASGHVCGVVQAAENNSFAGGVTIQLLDSRGNVVNQMPTTNGPGSTGKFDFSTTAQGAALTVGATYRVVPVVDRTELATPPSITSTLPAAGPCGPATQFFQVRGGPTTINVMNGIPGSLVAVTPTQLIGTAPPTISAGGTAIYSTTVDGSGNATLKVPGGFSYYVTCFEPQRPMYPNGGLSNLNYVRHPPSGSGQLNGGQPMNPGSVQTIICP